MLSLGVLAIDVYLHMKKMNPDFISFNLPDVGMIKNYVKKKDKALLVWTVRTPKAVEKAISCGANNIIFEKVDLNSVNFTMDSLEKVK